MAEQWRAQKNTIVKPRAGARAGRLMIFFNDISVHTPPRHVHAAVAAVRHFGKVPVEDLPLESFQVPEFENFESFRRRIE